jgi:transcriptional regulator with XRE-family HTH domain
VPHLAVRLRKFIQDKGWTLRQAEEHFKISRSRLSDLMNEKVDSPEVETLTNLAAGLELPLWQVIEDFGINLGLSQAPSDLARRLAGLVETSPEYAPLAPYLLTLHPDDLNGLLAFLETQQRLRARGRSDEPTK